MSSIPKVGRLIVLKAESIPVETVLQRMVVSRARSPLNMEGGYIMLAVGWCLQPISLIPDSKK